MKRQAVKRELETVRLSIENRQRGKRFTAPMRILLREIATACVSVQHFPYPAEAHLFLVGPRTIRAMNRRFRNKDMITDVLSFPALWFVEEIVHLQPGDRDPHTGLCFLGDIAICMPRMREQAQVYGHGETRELAFLMAHGMLHLLGLDHETKQQEARMFSMQEMVLARLGIGRDPMDVWTATTAKMCKKVDT